MTRTVNTAVKILGRPEKFPYSFPEVQACDATPFPNPFLSR
jgi:hypothetical protein